jgi:protein SCO1/2
VKIAKFGMAKPVIYSVLGVLLVLAGCEKQSAPVVAPDKQTFSVNGVVKELAPDGKTVVIQHEAIPNYMAGMTMPFDVHDTNELRGLKAGDAISFHLVVTSTDGWVEDIVRRATSSGDRSAAAAPYPTNGSSAATDGLQISPALEPLDEGDILPNYHFTNELGQPVDLDQYHGGVIAFTFFFTSCPFPNYCPRLTSNFSQAAALLNKATNAPARWQLLSITFDPKTDTPARLLSYANTAHYDPAHWSFLTGDAEQIGNLADQFGETFFVEGGSISHNLRTVVVDPSGVVRKIYLGNGWTGADLAQEMITAGRQ